MIRINVFVLQDMEIMEDYVVIIKMVLSELEQLVNALMKESRWMDFVALTRLEE